MVSVKLNVNLQVGRKVFPAGVYNEPYPAEIIAEIEADSRHISKIELPNIKQPKLETAGAPVTNENRQGKAARGRVAKKTIISAD